MKYAGFALAITALSQPVFAQGEAALPISDSGDTGWVLLTSITAMVLAISGLAFFFGGQLRKGSQFSTAMQLVAVFAIVSVIWVTAGYTFAFGPVSDGWLGGGSAFLLGELGQLRGGTALPESAFALLQFGFVVIAAGLLTGAWVERARFGWAIGVAALWVLVVYAPIAHWLWGGGWLASTYGTLDFSGGLTIHTSVGISAITIAMLLGPRSGLGEQSFEPHSPTLAMIGGGLLWFAFISMHGGAALGANENAASAIISTQLAASSAVLTWLMIERFNKGRITKTGWTFGAMAGLAAIAPAAVFVSPVAAITFGIAAALTSFGAKAIIQNRFKLDDASGLFAIHGVGGILGTLLLAPFLSAELGGTGYFGDASMASQLGAQAIGIGAVMVWSAVGSAIIALMVSLIIPMRVSQEDEEKGLDQVLFGKGEP